jgi:hypothetical protein
MTIVVQCYVELSKGLAQEEDTGLISLLLHFYSTIYQVPYNILFLSINGLVVIGHHKEALDVLQFCLQPKKPEDTISKRPFSSEQYESLTQIYLFHVVPALNLWDEANNFLKAESELTQGKKEVNID